jgi:2-polyprenyl-3-methyl-5-hydroxy-6-metoxy-1,4-benzoquinol methylase
MTNVTARCDELIQTTPRLDCYACGKRGESLYVGLDDNLFDIPGTWNTRRCPSCGLLWLDPVPLETEIPKLYQTYFTHDASFSGGGLDSRIRELSMGVMKSHYGYSDDGTSRISPLAYLASCIGPVREYLAGSALWLPASLKGKVLDVGCGNGGLLVRLRDLGWHVCGVEPDPAARNVASKNLGTEIYASIDEVPSGAFDVVTMSHVIEHVPDPRETLRQCSRPLKTGGRLVITTPNANSWGREKFGQAWVPLDPPRHLMVFTPISLSQCLADVGLKVETCTTPSRSAHFTWYSSTFIAQNGNMKMSDMKARANWWMHLRGFAFQIAEYLKRDRKRGEEIYIVASKP